MTRTVNRNLTLQSLSLARQSVAAGMPFEVLGCWPFLGSRLQRNTRRRWARLNWEKKSIYRKMNTYRFNPVKTKWSYV